MKITFDSQNWQPVVRPDKFPNNPDRTHYMKIGQAIRAKKIQPFVVDVTVSLEGIPRADRYRYFGGSLPHPGIAPVLKDRLADAAAMGFKVLRAPRIGLDIPAEVSALYPIETDEERALRQKQTSEFIRAVEGRGFGKDLIEQIGNDIGDRLSLRGAWHQFLRMSSIQAEQGLIADAIGEWADEDAVAAHIGYGNNIFCSNDFGKTASKKLGDSILSPANRSWLNNNLGVQFIKLDELAGWF